MGSEQHSLKQRAEVHIDDLRKIVDPTIFEFQTTEEVPELNTIIGQERGSTVMRFGLQVQKLVTIFMCLAYQEREKQLLHIPLLMKSQKKM